MAMLKRGYGAVRNLRGKSGARFPPSTVLGVLFWTTMPGFRIWDLGCDLLTSSSRQLQQHQDKPK